MKNGAHFENAVAQALTANGLIPYFCKKKNLGELDFVLELDSKVIAIEVKSGSDYKTHRALDKFMHFPGYKIDRGYVLSKGNIESDGNVTYFPIYMSYLIREKKLDSMIVNPDISGL